MDQIVTNYVDIDSKKNLRLEVHRLRGDSDWKHYEFCLSELPQNPFIKKELLIESNEEIVYFTLFDNDNRLIVFLPLILREIIQDSKKTGYYDISSPYGYGGPIYRSEFCEISLPQFWNEVDKWYHSNNIVSEFIRFNFDGNWKGYTGKLVPTLKNICGKILPEEELWQNFKPKVRNNVRKALKSGLEVNIFHNDIGSEQIKEFYNIYITTMKRHHAEKIYFHNLDYFTEYINNNPGCCAIALAFKDKLAISAELLLLSNDIIYSFLGGTDNAFFAFRPNDLLKWEVMKWGLKNGYSYYYLGGGRVENDSLYRYKKRYFPKDEDLMFHTGRKVVNPKVYEDLVSKNPKCANDLEIPFFPFYRYNAE